MAKKLLWLGLGALLLAALLYFFLLPSDYTVTFKANALPGTINQTIKAWNYEAKGEIVDQEGLNFVEQRFTFGDSLHRYRWKIDQLTDTSSQVTLQIKDLEHSLKHRLQKPFQETEFQKRSAQTAQAFFDYLNDHIDLFKVKIDGITEIPSTYCAYVPLEGKQFDKARGMMDYYTLLSNVLYNNQVELNGTPLVEITEWDMENDSISYNFCFPIIRSDKLPLHPQIKYKRLFAKKAVKATYNGNYITSDRAWYALVNYAETNDLEYDLTPIEFFFNNPNAGGNELEWRADIYLPLK